MPTLPGIAPPATFGRRASGEDFGAAEAQARGQQGATIARGVGELADIGQRIKQAADDMRLGRKAAEVSAELDRARFELEADPDIDTHESRFEDTSRKVLEQAKQGLDPVVAQRLDDRVFPALAHAKLQVSGQVRTRRVANADADRKQMLQLNSDQSAQTFDPVRRAQIRGQTVGTLDQALAAGLIDQAQHDASVRTFDRSVSEADLRRLTREDPAQAFQRLSDPADPIRAGMTQAEAEQWRTSALAEHQQQLAEARAAASYARVEQERAQKLAEDEVMRNADDLLAQGDLGGLQGYLAQTRQVMTPEHRRFYLDRLAAGGGFGAERTDPDTQIDLARRASRGEDVSSAANAALRTGKITKSDYGQFLKASEDRRFGDAFKELEGALRVGDAIDDPTARAKSARATADLQDFVLAKPQATRDEVFKYARQLAQDASLVNLGTLSEIRPTLAVPVPGKPNQIDIAATAQALEAARQSGQIDDFVYQVQRRRIARWKQLQEAGQGSGAGEVKK